MIEVDYYYAHSICFELLFADDLVIRVATMENLGICVSEWGVRLLLTRDGM